MSRRLSTPATPFPRTHLLSNTQYNVMLTNAGSGYSTCRGLDVTRWREDATRDCVGPLIYIKDVGTDAALVGGFQPTCRTADALRGDLLGRQGRRSAASTRRSSRSPRSPSRPRVSREIRRVTLTNHDTRVRELELTSYAEVVLIGHGGDLTHPAFGKLFLETEWVADLGGPDLPAPAEVDRAASDLGRPRRRERRSLGVPDAVRDRPRSASSAEDAPPPIPPRWTPA